MHDANNKSKMASLITTSIKLPFILICQIKMKLNILQCNLKTYLIPQILGYIDGTYIPITVSEEGYRDFVNRKGWASYNVQAIVDHNGRFRNVFAKHPGSVHDAAAFKDSTIYKHSQEIIPQMEKHVNGQGIPFMIVGDPAYPLLPWLIKSYSGSVSPEEKSFNVYLNSARVEMAFGRLKARWRMLQKKVDCNYKFVPQLIVAC